MDEVMFHQQVKHSSQAIGTLGTMKTITKLGKYSETLLGKSSSEKCNKSLITCQKYQQYLRLMWRTMADSHQTASIDSSPPSWKYVKYIALHFQGSYRHTTCTSSRIKVL
eukprot:10421006-Ditylum_brightwellii.AAC.1